MSGGGGSTEIKDTPAQKKLASIAAQRFNLYQQYYVPLENQFIGEVKALTQQGKFDSVESVVTASLNPEFQNARNMVSNRLMQQNVDPTSGRYTAAMEDLSQRQARGTGLATASGASSQIDRYYQGMQNIVAMGQGVAGTGISGLGDIATMSGQIARAQAQGGLDKYMAEQEVTGTAVGTALGVGMQSKGLFG